MSGAELIYVPLVPPEFNFDPAVLEAAFAQGAKALVLCNPSNPCGKVFTLEEMQIIADLAKRFDAYVITDEVYEHIVYAPHVHRYISALPGSSFFASRLIISFDSTLPKRTRRCWKCCIVWHRFAKR